MIILLPKASVTSPAAKIPGQKVEQSGWIIIPPRSLRWTSVAARGVGLQAHGDERALYRQFLGFGTGLFSDGDYGQVLAAGEFENSVTNKSMQI
jgi:hypothetical protein